MPRSTMWPRLLAEGTVIVASILLALAADTWIDGVRERADERASLDLLGRDLAEAVTQLGEFESLLTGSSDAALYAYSALSGPRNAIDEPAVSAAIIRAGARRTIRIPEAAYTDLLSTDGLRLVSDRALRDRIVRFYEAAQRDQSILTANNSEFIDRLFLVEIHGRGLVLPRPEGRSGLSALDGGMDAVSTALGSDFRHPPDPLWSYPPTSPEWDRVRGSLLQLAKALNASRLITVGLLDDAMSLQSEIAAAVGGADD